MRVQFLQFTLISRGIPDWLWLWYREQCSQFLGNRNWTRGAVKRLNYLLFMAHQFTFCGLCCLFNSKGAILTRTYYINTTIFQFCWELMVKVLQVREARRWIINFFIMTDQVEKENVQIKYCPTYNMWGYFMTKPTQGAKFSNFRNYVLGGNE